jgi:hypothetical protein
MARYSSMASRVRNLTSGKRQRRKRSALYNARLRRHSYSGVTVRFLTRRGRVLLKVFKTRQSAARAIRGWRSKGGKVLSSH